jgi:sigma-B regulation protein RsbU (phosphoserine phosphatase)
MDLDRPDGERLRAIVRPFGAPGSGVAITIGDIDGRVVASAGSVPRGEAVTARAEIVVAGVVVGRVDGLGAIGRPLLEALVTSVATTVGALMDSVAAGRDAVAASEAGAHRIEAELALGRRIQRSFVPLIPPDLPGYEVASQYEAAREVGGDFFDVFRIRGRPGRLAICIADVTGKGIAAALLMAFARPLLHAAIDHARTPGDALERTNRILVEERRSALFITALCATLDMRAGLLRLANAGHEPPLLVRAGSERPVWLEASGPLLGAYGRLDLTECSITLAPGDLVLLYTDGVTDAQAASGERFGENRLVEAVQSSPTSSAADVVGTVCDAYHQFQGQMPAADDVTMVAIRRLPRRRRVRAVTAAEVGGA